MKKLGINTVLTILTGVLLCWVLVCARAGGVVTPASVLSRLAPCLLAFAAFGLCFIKRRELTQKIIFVVLNVYALVECGLGTAQLLGWARSRHAFFQLTGNFLNPAPYACLLAVAVVCCAVALLRRGAPGYVKILSWITLTWSSAMVIIARSRAVWLGLVLALLVATVRETDILQRIKHRRIVICGVLIIFLAGCAGAWMLKPASAEARFYTWETDFLAIGDHSLTGVGPGAEMGAYADAQADYFHSHVRSARRQQAADVPQKPFNEFLGIGMACGIPGLLLAIAVFALALAIELRSRSPYAYILIVVGTFAFFSFPLCQLALSLLLMLAIADAVTSGERDAKRLASLAIALTFLAGAMIPLACREAFRRSELKAVLADSKSQQLDTKRLAGHYKSLCNSSDYLLIYAKSLYDERLYPEADAVLDRLTRMTADPVVHIMRGEIRRLSGDPAGAAADYLKSYYIAPSRLTPLHFLTVLYQSYGLTDQARQTREFALSIPVDKDHTATLEVRNQLEQIILADN